MDICAGSPEFLVTPLLMEPICQSAPESETTVLTKSAASTWIFGVLYPGLYFVYNFYNEKKGKDALSSPMLYGGRIVSIYALYELLNTRLSKLNVASAPPRPLSCKNERESTEGMEGRERLRERGRVEIGGRIKERLRGRLQWDRGKKEGLLSPWTQWGNAHMPKKDQHPCTVP